MNYLLSIILILSFTFSGCHEPKPPEIVPNICPKIEVLAKVKPIDVVVDGNGSIVSDSNTANLMIGAYQLRKSEGYYFTQITNYNTKFAKEAVDK